MISFVWDYIIVFLIILTVVVVVHEMGHYLVARACGIRIETFSIGFGPEVCGITSRSGTRWKISLLPLGGYVKMFGDANAASMPDNGAAAHWTPEEKKSAFFAKSVGQRAAVVAAGPLSNFVFGILVMAIMFMIYGQLRTTPVIGMVEANSPAAIAGLQADDRVLAANGETIDRFQDLQRIVRMTVGEPVTLVIKRAGGNLNVVVQPRITEMNDAFGNKHKVPFLGVVAREDATEIVRHDPFSALMAATDETAEMISATVTGIGQMVTGRRQTDELGGPLRIAKGAGQAAQLGGRGIVFYIILLSINLGFINLFPVPLLDGGHLLFYGVEALRGRPLGPHAQEFGFRIGLILVFALMIFATINDLGDLKVWDFLKSFVS